MLRGSHSYFSVLRLKSGSTVPPTPNSGGTRTPRTPRKLRLWGHDPLLHFAYTTEMVVVEFRGCWIKAGINAEITFNYYSDLRNCKFTYIYRKLWRKLQTF